jgi:hypothetical protein
MLSAVNSRGPQFLCAFAILREEKILLGGRVRRPAILRGRLQRRQAAKSAAAEGRQAGILGFKGVVALLLL